MLPLQKNDPLLKRVFAYFRRKLATNLNMFFNWLEYMSDSQARFLINVFILFILLAIIVGIATPHFWSGFWKGIYYEIWFLLTLFLAKWLMRKTVVLIIKIRRWAEENSEDGIE